MKAKDKESPWNEIFDNFSFLVSFSLLLSPSLLSKRETLTSSRQNIHAYPQLWRPFLPSSKKYWILSQKSCRSSSWSVDRLIRGKKLSCHCLNYHRLVLISRSSLEEKKKQLCRKYLVLASERRSSSADPDQRSQRTRSLYLSRRRRHERGPPRLGLQMSWQHRCLSNLSKNEKSQYFWILITLILGIQGWNLVESHQTQISFQAPKRK